MEDDEPRKGKNELEDLSFKFEHPEEYEKIEQKLAFTEKDRNKLFDDFTAPIREALDKMGLKYSIKARVKTPYSIWTKMQNKHVTFEEIYDILAVRIVFVPLKREEEVNECFQIYVSLNKIYKSHPDRLRDWVNHPKANGYQALHVTLMSRTGQWIEVQIRSDRMNEIAEQGFAAHWKYKEHDQQGDDDNELNDWLRTIKEILDDPQPDAMTAAALLGVMVYGMSAYRTRMIYESHGARRFMPLKLMVRRMERRVDTVVTLTRVRRAAVASTTRNPPCGTARTWTSRRLLEETSIWTSKER